MWTPYSHNQATTHTHTQSPEHQTHKLYLFHSICRNHIHSKMLSLDSTPLDGSLSPLEVQLFTVNCTIWGYFSPLISKVTRWTFFRDKLVFEFEFEISWSLGPLDLGTLGPWDSWTSALLQHLLIIPFTSSYLLLSLPSTLLLWYGLVICGGGDELWQLRMRLEMDLWPLYWS